MRWKHRTARKRRKTKIRDRASDPIKSEQGLGYHAELCQPTESTSWLADWKRQLSQFPAKNQTVSTPPHWGQCFLLSYTANLRFILSDETDHSPGYRCLHRHGGSSGCTVAFSRTFYSCTVVQVVHANPAGNSEPIPSGQARLTPLRPPRSAWPRSGRFPARRSARVRDRSATAWRGAA